mmetsp:Transcript_12616/g.53277  ORF Transcript_12616/g.53277 Transcript_12616/m.53277 type:complete len:248 (-) Transcript_12616:143-886(-)
MGRRVKRRVQRAARAAAGPGLAVALVAEVEIRAPRAVPPDAEHRGFIAPIAGELGELRAGGRRPRLRRRGSPEGTAHPGPAFDGFARDSRGRLGRRGREEASGVVSRGVARRRRDERIRERIRRRVPTVLPPRQQHRRRRPQRHGGSILLRGASSFARTVRTFFDIDVVRRRRDEVRERGSRLLRVPSPRASLDHRVVRVHQRRRRGARGSRRRERVRPPRRASRRRSSGGVKRGGVGGTGTAGRVD